MRSERELRQLLNSAELGDSDYDTGVYNALAYALGDTEERPYEEDETEDADAEHFEDEDDDEEECEAGE